MESIPLHELERVSKEARRLSYQLADGGPAYHDYQPGNGSAYKLVLCLDVVLKNGPLPGAGSERQLIVSLLNFSSSYNFALSGSTPGGYIAEKLRVGDADGEALAYLFNEIAHHLRN